ncbi:MAG: helix-turn-helix transcriptional regulator [Peptococcaceae bacterium]|nr:helix-turn-helix transcriptional regulator [Peptococcaceae bacterium]
MQRENEILIHQKTILLPGGMPHPVGSTGAEKEKEADRPSRINETEFWDMKRFWAIMGEQFNMNVSKLGRHASIPKSTIHSIVRGETIPDIRALAGFAYAMELEPDVFFDIFMRGYLEYAKRELIVFSRK